MHFDGFDDELWDEFKWEAHLNEVEKKSDQLRKFISSDPKGNTPRWITLLQESLNEDDAFEAYVEEELLLDEAYFPEDEDDWEDEDDYEDDDFLFGEFDEFSDTEDSSDSLEDFDSGEEWKALSEEFVESDYGNLENLIIYTSAKDLAVEILKWAETIPPKLQTKVFQEFVGDALKIGAKIAGGYSFGYEADFLGANIAYTKKALHCANSSLKLLQSLKKEKYFRKDIYSFFHSQLFELRNDIGVYVQELRDRFKYGID